jgi:hypothetical protein
MPTAIRVGFGGGQSGTETGLALSPMVFPVSIIIHIAHCFSYETISLSIKCLDTDKIPGD